MMKGLIHCHSENSRYDSAMNVKTLCERAKELGYEAVSLTDHGTLTGIDDFRSAAKEVGIKPILGVEAYVQEDDSLYKRFHLILLAKDAIGYQGISKAVSESNKRIDMRGFPRVNKEILEKYFGSGANYHDHVIATSACMGGVLTGLLVSPFEFDREIAKLKEKQGKYPNPKDEAYLRNKERLVKQEADIEQMAKEREELTACSKRPFKKKETALSKLSGEEYEKAKAALDAEKKETKEAAEKLEQIRVDIALAKKDATSIRNEIKEQEAGHKRFYEYQDQIDELEKKKIKSDDLKKIVTEEALYYDQIFGHGNFYIEIQYHGFLDDSGIEIEKLAMSGLAEIAEETGIPMSAANDAHIPDRTEASIRARQIICSLRYAKNGYVSEVTDADRELYVKTEEELREALKNVLTEKQIDEAIQNTYSICDQCNCEFVPASHYPKFKGMKEGETAAAALRRIAAERIEYRFPSKKGWTKEYQERLSYELDVIESMGYADYFLIVQDFLEFGRKLGHLTDEDLDWLKENVKSISLKEMVDFVESHQSLPGFAIGAGRGSAAGSLVAYLIGITNIIDPLKYDLLFERFLNKDRVSMPDVDSDLSPDIRDLVVEYCKKLYGVESVANIVTKGYMAPKGAIRNVARIIGIEKGQRDYYLSLADRIAKQIPTKPGTSFATCEDELREMFQADPSDTKETVEMKRNANEVIDQAKLVENVFLNYGMHAAGVIIADGNPIDDYVPLMRDEKSGDMKVQCDMVQAEEEHGLLKFDFLGLRNLKIVTLALRSIKKRFGIDIDINQIPIEAAVLENIFATGRTGSIFQFESPGMKKMLRSARPNCLEDLIALVSLYRPGPMDFIPQYIESKQHPEKTTYLCPELKPILGKTYGTIVYQEQVMEIFQKLAGYSLSQADNVRRFMSKKKMDKLEHEREAFIFGDKERKIDGCKVRGIPEEIARKLFDQMVEFAKYAFNKSHAAAYAMLSYITAYLKYHYPADYMCAVLNCTEDIKKMPSILNDCRENGITVLPPDVNRSDVGFSVVDDKVMFGINSIKGTKAGSVDQILAERAKNGQFHDFKEFIRRTSIDKTTMENMIRGGAMDAFSRSRESLIVSYKPMSDVMDKITDKQEVLAELKEKLAENPEDKGLNRKYNNAVSAIELLEKKFEVLRIYDIPDDYKERLRNEKEILGFFITGHPMDIYKDPSQMGCVPIEELKPDRRTVSIVGVIENLELKARNSDGAKFATFRLEDKTGIVDVCCFSKAYKDYSEFIKEDEVVKITGYLNERFRDDSEEPELSFYANEVRKIDPALKDIYIESTVADWNEVLTALRKGNYITESGHPLLVYDTLLKEFRKTEFFVSRDVLGAADFHATMRS